VLAFEIGADAFHLGAGLLDRYAGPQPRDYGREMAAAVLAIGWSWSVRHEYIHVSRRQFEPIRQNSDGCELAVPEAMAEDNHLVTAAILVLGTEARSDMHPDAEEVEQVNTSSTVAAICSNERLCSRQSRKSAGRRCASLLRGTVSQRS
jgi:hypothetical protein